MQVNLSLNIQNQGFHQGFYQSILDFLIQRIDYRLKLTPEMNKKEVEKK